MNDMTEKERKINLLLRKEAENRRREGKRLGYMKLWMEEKLWRYGMRLRMG